MMNKRELPPSPAIPPRMEESWRLRLKLEETLRRYLTAAQHRKALQERGPAADDALARARQAESQTLDEYNRVLRVFTDLTCVAR